MYKPRIFVSSTIKDLTNEREAAKRAIEKLPAIPMMSEFTMNSVDKSSVDACIDTIKRADFYILILGGRYGWELENGISITELEFDTAFKEGKPIFVFDTQYEKEAKQKRFAGKVGNQRFWKTINDAFELESEIVKSYAQYVEEKKYEKKQNTETIYSNLLPVQFPEHLNIAELNIDRDEVIEASWQTEFKLKKRTHQAKVVKAAIYQKGLIPVSDWVLFENKLMTFHDLSLETHPLSSVIDRGTITTDPCSDFYDIDENHLNVFKFLLRKCMERKLYHMNIRNKGKGRYAYAPTDETLRKREVNWVGKNSAKRTVFELKMQKKNPEKVSYGKHFSFRFDFHYLRQKWYVAIVPDWFISYDGRNESNWGYEQLNYLKRNERNGHIYNHLRFITHELSVKKQAELFEENFDYKFLNFGQLNKAEAFPRINENDWFNTENKDSQERLVSGNELILFDV